MTAHRKMSGFVFDGIHSRSANVDVRFTSDDKGETLSLAVDNIMIAVPFKTVESLVKNERSRV